MPDKDEILDQIKDGLNAFVKNLKGACETCGKFCNCKELSEEDQRRYAPKILLGALPVAVFALVIVVVGQLTLQFASSDCILDGDNDTTILLVVVFLNLAVWFSQFFLMTFAWTFLGFEISYSLDVTIFGKLFHLRLPLCGDRFYLAVPYRSLKWVAGVYFFHMVLYFIAFIIGTVAIATAAECAEQTPSLLSFSTFIVVIFWIAFGLSFMMLCKSAGADAAKFGAQYRADLIEQLKMEPKDDIDVVKDEFKKFDHDKTGFMDASELADLLKDIGLNFKKSEVEAIEQQLDKSGDGVISQSEFIKWYKKDKFQRQQSEETEGFAEYLDKADEEESYLDKVLAADEEEEEEKGSQNAGEDEEGEDKKGKKKKGKK